MTLLQSYADFYEMLNLYDFVIMGGIFTTADIFMANDSQQANMGYLQTLPPVTYVYKVFFFKHFFRF